MQEGETSSTREKEEPLLNESTTSGSLLSQANDLFRKRDHAGCLVVLRNHWISNPSDIEAAKLMWQLAKAGGKKDLTLALERFIRSELMRESNPQILFEAAYRLLNEKESQIASLLFQRCLDLAPQDQDVHYELGFSLMCTRRFREALPHFEFVASRANDFDNQLNICVCHTMERKVSEAKAAADELERLAQSKEEKKECALRRSILKRINLLDPRKAASPRDWAFALYGSLLINEGAPKDLTGKSLPVASDYTGVAATMLVLKAVLAEMGMEYDIIEYYSSMSRPLAESLARLMDLPAEHYGGNIRKERALLMMAWGTDIIGPHNSFVQHTALRTIFSYGLTTEENLPVTPDIIGCLAPQCQMPWATQLLSQEDKPAKRGSGHPMNQVQIQAVEKILERAGNIESKPEIIELVEELNSYYAERRGLLVLGNPESYPERAQYTAEILI